MLFNDLLLVFSFFCFFSNLFSSVVYLELIIIFSLLLFDFLLSFKTIFCEVRKKSLSVFLSDFSPPVLLVLILLFKVFLFITVRFDAISYLCFFF